MTYSILSCVAISNLFKLNIVPILYKDKDVTYIRIIWKMYQYIYSLFDDHIARDPIPYKSLL